MQSRKQREKSVDDFIDFTYGIAVLGGIYAWASTRDVTVGLVTFVLGLACIVLILRVYKSHRMAKLRAAGMDEIDYMTGEQFEERLLAHFKTRDYRVQLTTNGSDFGADLVLKKDGMKTVVQAKRWTKSVTVKAVQEIVAAKAHYGAANAMVITNSTFTTNAIALARSNKIDLWDRDRLARELSREGDWSATGRPEWHAANEHAVETTTHWGSNGRVAPMQDPNGGRSDPIHPGSAAAVPSAPSCPRCNMPMVVRSSQYGQFWGCPRFPSCRGKRAVSDLG